MEFLKYQHVERYGTTEVEGIEQGKCYIFPKLDGTNSSVWLDAGGEVKAGSRNRELSLEKDNAGFYAMIKENPNVLAYLKDHPDHRLYGEFLVPHTLKNYEDTAWQKFYVFDVCIGDSLRYIPYEEYHKELEKYNIDYIKPLGVVENGTEEDFTTYLDTNTYLVKEGTGEGIVIKRYDFSNKYGRTTWAKIVASEFRNQRIKNHQINQMGGLSVEEQIVEQFITEALVEKEYAKIVTENNGIWESKMIPMFINKVWYALITEEMWHILKKHKNCTINFKKMQKLTFEKIKAIKAF